MMVGGPGKSGRRPNFLLIVADDLGYSDLSCYGSEIKTPNIDRIAREGAQFLDFYSAAMCSPTRSMILSGTDNHIAGVGQMGENKAAGHQEVKGYEGYLNFDVAALPEVLHDNDYLTLMSGKWHLGMRPYNNPAARGFDKSFALLPGCSNHFAYEPQFTDYEAKYGEHPPAQYTVDGKLVDLVPNTTDSYDRGFFSTEFYTTNLLRYLDQRDDTQPFFAYLPFAAPHWPLQCSKEDRQPYEGMYVDGPEGLRARRLASLKEAGLIKEDIIPHEIVNFEKLRWNEMSEKERNKSSRAMEVYAGMVAGIDRNVGRVMDYLEAKGELDNTFILFMSDNGAAGAWLESQGLMGRASLLKVIEEHYDNSLENMGNHNSFFSYGPFWAQAATAPSRLYKSFSTEGGIRVPCVIRYPPLVRPQQIVRAFANATDIMPTILDIAAVQHPAVSCKPGEKAMHRDRPVHKMSGKSWVDFFSSDKPPVGEGGIYGEAWWFGWELHGMAGLRKGNFKIVWIPEGKPTGQGRWQLYDLIKDPGERHDLAGEEPKRLEELLKHFDEYVKSSGALWGEARSKLKEVASSAPDPQTLLLKADWDRSIPRPTVTGL